MKLEIICTRKSRVEITKELRNNNVPFEFGDTMEKVQVEDSPKTRMAIRMTRERKGLNSLIVKDHITGIEL